MPTKAHNPPRIEKELVWLNISVGLHREVNELRNEISELTDRIDSIQ